MAKYEEAVCYTCWGSLVDERKNSGMARHSTCAQVKYITE